MRDASACRRCGDCQGEEHHLSSEYVGFAVNEPEHPAAKAGHASWFECKHCDAWFPVCELCMEPAIVQLEELGWLCEGCAP